MNATDIKDKITHTSENITEAKSKLDSVKNTIESVKSAILNNSKVESSKVSEINSTVSSAISNIESSASNLSQVSKEIGSKETESKIADMSSTLNAAKDASDTVSKEKDGTDTFGTKKTKVVDAEDSEIFDSINLSKGEAMAYDSNGMKHFMNVWLGIMSSEGIPYTTLGMRRWGVTTEDEKVFGNAFLERESSETFKTLDSDGKLYWLSDYNSRHYYGEAADITGDLQSILEAVAKNDNVLDAMHKFGICMQIETSESGHSKGTHFHCSTDPNNPQTKFWGVVNRIRETNDLPLYTVVTASEYFEKETKNTVKLA